MDAYDIKLVFLLEYAKFFKAKDPNIGSQVFLHLLLDRYAEDSHYLIYPPRDESGPQPPSLSVDLQTCTNLTSLCQGMVLGLKWNLFVVGLKTLHIISGGETFRSVFGWSPEGLDRDDTMLPEPSEGVVSEETPDDAIVTYQAYAGTAHGPFRDPENLSLMARPPPRTALVPHLVWQDLSRLYQGLVHRLTDLAFRGSPDRIKSIKEIFQVAATLGPDALSSGVIELLPSLIKPMCFTKTGWPQFVSMALSNFTPDVAEARRSFMLLRMWHSLVVWYWPYLSLSSRTTWFGEDTMAVALRVRDALADPSIQAHIQIDDGAQMGVLRNAFGFLALHRDDLSPEWSISLVNAVNAMGLTYLLEPWGAPEVKPELAMPSTIAYALLVHVDQIARTGDQSVVDQAEVVKSALKDVIRLDEIRIMTHLKPFLDLLGHLLEQRPGSVLFIPQEFKANATSLLEEAKEKDRTNPRINALVLKIMWQLGGLAAAPLGAPDVIAPHQEALYGWAPLASMAGFGLGPCLATLPLTTAHLTQVTVTMVGCDLFGDTSVGGILNVFYFLPGTEISLDMACRAATHFELEELGEIRTLCPLAALAVLGLVGLDRVLTTILPIGAPDLFVHIVLEILEAMQGVEPNGAIGSAIGALRAILGVLGPLGSAAVEVLQIIKRLVTVAVRVGLGLAGQGVAAASLDLLPILQEVFGVAVVG